MKIDSPLFDSIRVKPGKDRRVKNDGPACQWAGCKEKATNFAPKGPNTEGRWHYCVKHVREYNQSYNFFAGMARVLVGFINYVETLRRERRGEFSGQDIDCSHEASVRKPR